MVLMKVRCVLAVGMVGVVWGERCRRRSRMRPRMELMRAKVVGCEKWCGLVGGVGVRIRLAIFLVVVVGPVDGVVVRPAASRSASMPCRHALHARLRCRRVRAVRGIFWMVVWGWSMVWAA